MAQFGSLMNWNSLVPSLWVHFGANFVTLYQCVSKILNSAHLASKSQISESLGFLRSGKQRYAGIILNYIVAISFMDSLWDNIQSPFLWVLLGQLVAICSYLLQDWVLRFIRTCPKISYKIIIINILKLILNFRILKTCNKVSMFLNVVCYILF